MECTVHAPDYMQVCTSFGMHARVVQHMCMPLPLCSCPCGAAGDGRLLVMLANVWVLLLLVQPANNQQARL